MKIGLGTVQFGLDYGISNTAGRVPASEVHAILELAARSGVEVLDTAAAYGDAERVLGAGLQHPFRIVTKLPRLPADLFVEHVAGWANGQFAGSLARLRCERVAGLLVHDAGDLLGERGDTLWEAMAWLKQSGKVGKIGASVYTGVQVDALLDRYPVDLVQLPINLLDRRLLAGGQLQRLKAHGVEVHARSLLLQGLLVMEPEHLGPHFAPAVPALRALRSACDREGITPLQAAIAYVNALPQVDCAVVGVTRAAELCEVLDAAQRTLPAGWYAGLCLDDETILDPSQWPRP